MSSGKHNERCNKSRRQNGSAKSLALNGPPASAGSSVNKAKRAHEAAKQMVDKEAIQKMLEDAELKNAQKQAKRNLTKAIKASAHKSFLSKHGEMA
eukprot:CAMPEP_0179453340 /NCGR_PEP_ID=MMETSP0799-20121207/37286_1 /TAXON_ID=46947 /ORGANISM="Geminigera cryophila, Strain CCMP2564" /LENGTH=95 /DNA_ID=CAMNT_0021250285 /DNA_START=151 /DNA_END=439 /DNA_ORIENTATION=-